jgi:hypothetical protein
MPEPIVPAPATTSTTLVTSAPAIAGPSVPTPAVVSTKPSVTSISSASPAKQDGADRKQALIASTFKIRNNLEKYVDVTDSDSGEPVEPTKEKANEDTKAKHKKKKSRKQKKEKTHSKQKPAESDIEMEESDENPPATRKIRDAGSTQQEIQAQIKNLQKLLTAQPDAIKKFKKLLADQPQFNDESTESDIDVAGSNESSEDEDEDTKPSKKGKEPAKKGKKSTVKKVAAADDPESFTYYKGLGADSRKIVQDLKDRFTRDMFENWWPEGSERISWGEKAYDDAVAAWKDVIVISSGEEVPSSKKKGKSKHTREYFTSSPNIRANVLLQHRSNTTMMLRKWLVVCGLTADAYDLVGLQLPHRDSQWGP